MLEGSLLLVNTPYTSAATARLLTWIEVRYGRRPLTAVNTHFHVDALGGNAALVAAGARIYGSDATARLVASGAPPCSRRFAPPWPTGRPRRRPLPTCASCR